MKKINEITGEIIIDLKSGLDGPNYNKSRELYGSNRLTPPPRKSLWTKYFEKFDDPMIRILLVAIAVSIGVSVIKGESDYYDSIGIIIAVIMATGVAFLSELKSDREFEILTEKKEAKNSRVIREGKIKTVKVEDIAVGDLIHLDTGDEIPADGWLVSAENLRVDQSLMTGESLPVKKVSPKEFPGDDESASVIKGTSVIEGQGYFIVAGIGDGTEIGKIAASLSGDKADAGKDGSARERVSRKFAIDKIKTPLQIKLENLARLISGIGYTAAVLITVTLLIRGWIFGEITGFNLATAKCLTHYLMMAVVIIVVSVPEGLPMSVTISLALAMRKMTRANALVRQLIACETIGSATVICSDKTGTLTKNKMELKWIGEGIAPGTKRNLFYSAEDCEKLDPSRDIDSIILNCALNSTAFLEEKNGEQITVGNATEGALLKWIISANVNHEKLREKHPVKFRIPFSHATKLMYSVVELGNKTVIFLKGAPENVIKLCENVREKDAASIEYYLGEASSHAMRTLAFACKTVDRWDEACAADPEFIGKGFKYCGFAGIGDPVREDVFGAIADCYRAGVGVKMITGDNIDTAKAIGREIRLLTSDADICMTSDEFNAMTDDELKARMRSVKILARAKPLDKYRMVKLLQETGEVVAVTGDGTNDAPALKLADVGISMGNTGTEVAHEASKIVLLNDSFATIVQAMLWGRALYENIQRFLQFQLTVNASALIISFFGPIFGYPPLFSIVQLLWINIIMDSLAAVALCSEPPNRDLLNRPPVPRDQNMISRPMLINIVVTSIFFVAFQFTLLKYEFLGGGSQLEKSTIFFSSFILFQVWNALNCRVLVFERSALNGIFRNLTFWFIMAVIVVTQVLMVNTESTLFGVTKLSFHTWINIFIVTSTVLFLGELARILIRNLPEKIE